MEKKNHGDPPNRNLVLGRQTNLLPYSHNLEAESLRGGESRREEGGGGFLRGGSCLS